MNKENIVTFTEFEKILKLWKITLLKIIVGESAPLNGVKLKKAAIPESAIIGPILREDKIILPDGTTTFKTDDQILVMCAENEIESIELKFRNITLKNKITNYFKKIFKVKKKK
jgi:trk system potassium uptake protein TrkA